MVTVDRYRKRYLLPDIDSKRHCEDYFEEIECLEIEKYNAINGKPTCYMKFSCNYSVD